MVDLVIFDLDDTLIDFASTRRAAYGLMGELLSAEGLDAKAYLAVCAEVDKPLFASFERGEISRADYRQQRFALPFERLALAPRNGLVAALNQLFMDCVNNSPRLHDDALPVLQALREGGWKTAILTNGPSDGQRRKLKSTGLGDAVDHVAIGEEVGASKPLALAFHHVTGRFGLPAERAVMVGDSPSLDHDAARSAGLSAWLLDRAGEHRSSGRECIASLHEVMPRLARG